MVNRTLAAALGIALSTQAVADGNGLGLYVGGLVSNSRLSTDIEGGAPPPTVEFSNKAKDTGQGWGVFAGWQNQLGMFSYALELEVAEGRSEADTAPNMGSNYAVASLEENESYSVSLLGGYEVAPGTTLYGRIGYISTDFTARAIRGSGATFGRESKDLDGWIAGIGIEHKVADRISIRGDWRRTEYSDDINVREMPGLTPEFAEFDDVSRDAFTLGVVIDI